MTEEEIKEIVKETLAEMLATTEFVTQLQPMVFAHNFNQLIADLTNRAAPILSDE